MIPRSGSRARALRSSRRATGSGSRRRSECLERDFTDLVTHLRCPAEHWHRIRHSNFIERTVGETRRRVKVIGRLPDDRSCVSLVWAVLDRTSRGWRCVTQTPAGLRLLQDLRRQLLEPPILEEVVDDQAVTPAAESQSTRTTRLAIDTESWTPPTSATPPRAAPNAAPHEAPSP